MALQMISVYLTPKGPTQCPSSCPRKLTWCGEASSSEEVTRHTPTMTKEEEKKNQVTFPKASGLWDSKSEPFPPAASRCRENKLNPAVLAFQPSSLQPVSLSERHQSWRREQGRPYLARNALRLGTAWQGLVSGAGSGEMEKRGRINALRDTPPLHSASWELGLWSPQGAWESKATRVRSLGSCNRFILQG